MKNSARIIFGFSVLLFCVFLLQSCCRDNEPCPRLEHDDWMKKIAEDRVEYESTKGKSLTVEYGSLITIQDEDADCSGGGTKQCRCECFSSSSFSGIVLATNDLSGSISFDYNEDIDLKAKSNDQLLKVEFISGKGNFSNPFSPSYTQIKKITDTVGQGKVVTFENITKAPLQQLSGRSFKQVTALFLSEEKGLIGFEVDSSEFYYRVN